MNVPLGLNQSADWNGDGVQEPVTIIGFPDNLAGQQLFFQVTSNGFNPIVILIPSSAWPRQDWSQAIFGTKEGPRSAFVITTLASNDNSFWYVLVTSSAGATGSFSCQVVAAPSVFVPTALVTLNSSYDAAGNNTATGEASIASNNSGSTISRTYDALSDLTQVKQAMGGTVSERVDLGYNSDGSLHTVSRYAGDGTCFVASGTDLYDYDGRLTSLTYSSLNYINSATFVTPGYTFQYDAAGNLTESTSAMDGSTTYSNNASDQLTGATYNSSGSRSGAAAANNESYDFDQNGNRISGAGVPPATETCQTGEDNRLLWDGTYSYTYDNNGNRLTKTLGTSGATVRYTWDLRNRLVQEASYNSLADALAQQNATQVVIYTYDAYDRRIRETVTANGVTTYDYLAYADGGTQSLPGVFRGRWLGTSTPVLTDEYLVGAGQVFADDEVGSSSRAGQTIYSTGQADSNAAPGSVWILSNQVGTACDLAFYSVITGGPWLMTHRVFDSFGALESGTPGATPREPERRPVYDRHERGLRAGCSWTRTPACRMTVPAGTTRGPRSSSARTRPACRHEPLRLLWQQPRGERRSQRDVL